jgi:hypothetical protein
VMIQDQMPNQPVIDGWHDFGGRWSGGRGRQETVFGGISN